MPISVLFMLANVLSVLLRYTDSDYPFGIFKLFCTTGFLSKGRLEYNKIIAVSFSLLFWHTLVTNYRKLHCPRNTIHLNLFLSFILRAMISFIKKGAMVEDTGFPSDVYYDKYGQLHFLETGLVSIIIFRINISWFTPTSVWYTVIYILFKLLRLYHLFRYGVMLLFILYVSGGIWSYIH